MDFVKLKKNYEVFTVFKNQRELQKRTYGGEFFPANDEAGSGIRYLDFFQLIKDPLTPKTVIINEQKGIIAINLDTL